MSETVNMNVGFSGEGLALAGVLGAGLVVLAAAVGVTAAWLAEVLATSAQDVEARLQLRACRGREAGLRQLVAAGCPGPAADALARAGASLEALASEPGLLAVAEKWHGGSLDEARRTLAGAAEAHRRGRLEEAATLAERAEASLADVAFGSHAVLEDLQRRGIATVLASATADIGYSVTTDANQRAASVWATRGDSVLAMSVTGGGDVEMDMAGFDGVACRMESERLVSELEARGLRVRRAAASFHGRRGGGALVTAASRRARAGAMGPATALAAEAAAQPARASSPVPERRAAEHGDGGWLAPRDGERARRWLWSQEPQRPGLVGR